MDTAGVYTKLNLNRDKLTTGWNRLRIAVVLWSIVSLPFILYFGLNGDEPRTAFSKSLVASAVTIAVILTIMFLIRYAINKIRR